MTVQEVRLKQVCRWSETDREVFEPLADIVLFRLDEKTPFLALGHRRFVRPFATRAPISP